MDEINNFVFKIGISHNALIISFIAYYWWVFLTFFVN